MKSKIIIFAFILTDIVLSLYLLLHGKNIQLLNPQGQIAAGEQNLLLTMIFLMLLAGLPVIAFLYFVAFKYREGNKNAKYEPDRKYNKLLQMLWWGAPGILVIVLATMTWSATHRLDTYRPIRGVNPITIQVVALQWKWLFVYPEQHVATVNFIEFPVNTPVNFELTADAPMNSFWIPQLSGQIYAMSGMSTQLHIEASKEGDYNGSAAEISGDGFSGMKFVARADSRENFNTWVQSLQNSSKPLDTSAYNILAKPSENNSTEFYSPVEKNLYKSIIMKFMAPTGELPMKMD